MDVPPSPKVHSEFNPAGEEVLLKLMVASGQLNVSGEIKFGIGSVALIMFNCDVLSLHPAASVTINFTENMPAVL